MKRLTRYVLFLLSAVILTVIQAPYKYYGFAWFAYVPFIIACKPEEKKIKLFTSSYIAAVIYWLANLYWIQPVTTAGWIAICLYTALLWPLLSFTIQFCRTKKIPLFIAVPFLIVAAESLQGFGLGGFYWRYLAHSQYENLTLIQISDIFGAGGLSFIIAMVNGLIAEIIINYKKKKIRIKKYFYETAIIVLIIFITVIYGWWRINQTKDFLKEGPLVGVLQSNIPQSVKDSGSEEINEKIFSELLRLSSQIADTNTALIIWPETVVPGILDERVIRLLDSSSVHVDFDNRLKKHAGQTNTYILLGASGGVPAVNENLIIELEQRYNSAFLYTPNGNKSLTQYNKIHLVPFGEIVPFRKSLPFIHRLLMKFTPYDFDYNLDAGDEFTVFEIKSEKEPERTYKFSVMICYEDVVP